MAEASPSDAGLLSLARGGDVEAFGRLVERNQDYIYNAVYHLVGSEQDAEDVAQEVFMRAYRGLGGFRGSAKFSTWLYGIMLNCVRSFWRRRRSTASLGMSGADEDADSGRSDPAADDDGPLEATMRDERVNAVRAAIAALDADLREIVVLRDIKGLRYEELAEAIGVPTGTVKSRLHRARAALKRKLGPLYGQQG